MDVPVKPPAGSTSDPAGRAARPSAELQQLWFACLRKPWSSLVVMPAAAEGSARALAKALAEVGATYRNQPVRLVNAAGLDVAGAARVILEMSPRTEANELTVVCTDSVLRNQAGIPLCLAADAVLLVVDLEQADLTSAQRTIGLIGSSKFLGAVATHSERGLTA